MSATQWSQSSYLTDLIAQPQSYELSQALRLVQSEINMGLAPIEIRYRASLSLAFPQAEIESLALIAQESMDAKAGQVSVRQVEVIELSLG